MFPVLFVYSLLMGRGDTIRYALKGIVGEMGVPGRGLGLCVRQDASYHRQALACCSACNFDPQYQATSITYRADRRATHAPNNTEGACLRVKLIRSGRRSNGSRLTATNPIDLVFSL